MNARSATLVLLLLPFSEAAVAQNRAQLLEEFEAGRFQRVLDSTTPTAAPDLLYLAGQSLQKLGAGADAANVFRILAERREGDPWRLIGDSARQLVVGNSGDAVAAARRAVELAPNLADAHLQLGLALARGAEWSAAASAFEHATELAPGDAYPHYYAGLMRERSGRRDRMMLHFERFLQLAPQAPERGEVVRLLRR